MGGEAGMVERKNEEWVEKIVKRRKGRPMTRFLVWSARKQRVFRLLESSNCTGLSYKNIVTSITHVYFGPLPAAPSHPHVT